MFVGGSSKGRLFLNQISKKVVAHWKRQSYRSYTNNNNNNNGTLVRQVEFPPKTTFPLVWIAGSLFIFNDLYLHVESFTENEIKDWIRQSKSEVWGANRVIEGLHNIRNSLEMNHGEAYTGFLNIAPNLVKNKVIENSIKNNLKSENMEIVYEASMLLSELLDQKSAKCKPSEEQMLFKLVVETLEKWVDVKCLDCGNPSPVLSSLVSVVKKMSNNDKNHQDATALVDLINKIAEKIEQGKLDAEKVNNLDRTGLIKSRKIVVGGGGATLNTKNASLHDKYWYLNIGNDLVDICDNLVTSTLHTNDDREIKLVPAYGKLVRTLCNIDISSMNAEEVKLIDPLVLDLGLNLINAIEQKHDGGIHGKKPDSVPPKEWQYFRRLHPFLTNQDNKLWEKFNKSLDKIESVTDILAPTYTAGIIGYVYGMARSIWALQGVETPQGIIGSSPSPNYHNPSTATYSLQYQQQLQQQQHHHHNVSNFNHNNNPRWKHRLIAKHARLAAVGSMILIGYYHTMNALEKYIWVESEKTQLALAVSKVLGDSVLFLTVLRNAPFVFLPTFITAILFAETEQIENGIVVETDFVYPNEK